MKLTIYNDQPELLYPLTRLRPVWDVLVGGRTLKQQLCRTFPTADFSWQSSSRRANNGRLYLNGRACPTNALLHAIRTGQQNLLDQAPLLSAPWDLITWHDQLLLEEANVLTGHPDYTLLHHSTSSVIRSQHGPVLVHQTAQIGSYTVLEGPVIIAAHALVHDFTKITACFIGAVSKVAGEIAHSSFFPYANKQHFGFVGHSVVGAWVNIAGGTSTANLKNTLGPVRVDRGFGPENTALQFLGSILGEYVRTGLNTTLMPGVIADIGSHLYGTVTGYIPPLNIPLDLALKTIERTMARRGKKLTTRHCHILQNLYRAAQLQKHTTNS